jgi:hypothetical protein
MWREDAHAGKDIHKAIKWLANKSVYDGIAAGIAKDWKTVGSPSAIYYWRMWSYLYWLGVPKSGSQFTITSLPYVDLFPKEIEPQLSADDLFPVREAYQ